MTTFQSSPVKIWKTVKHAWKKLSKVARDSISTAFKNFPPNSCIPRRAKMKMKRTRRTNKATIEEIELTKDLTKLPMADQYFVTLNPLKRRIHLITERPTGGTNSFLTKTYSRMELRTTKKSNLLKSETMYPENPRAYIFINISPVKRQTKKRLVYS